MVNIFGYEIQLPPPFDSNYWQFIVLLLIWVGVALFIVFILHPIVKTITKKTKTKIDDTILSIIRGPVLVIIIAYGAISSLAVLGLSQDFLSHIMMAYNLILIIVITWISFKIFNGVIMEYGRMYAEKTKTNIDDILFPILQKLGTIIIVTFGIMFILNSLGIDITMFIMGMGVVGLVIAFAAQRTLSNFFAGMILLTDRPFKVGDMLLLESGEYCEVRDVGMISTKLYDLFEHTVIIIPNDKMASERIINLTEPDVRAKAKITVGVAYGSDIQKVKQILLDIANDQPAKDEEHEPIVRFTEFGDSSLNFLLIMWVKKIGEKWKTASDIREEIDRRFKEEGIEIPFPQRVVYFHDQTKEKSK
jgi:small-conductance mechanosensitive channel